MTVSQGFTYGFDTTSQAGSHAVMVALRTRLLEVGLTQVEIDGGYDASPEGGEDQIPTVAEADSPRMVFAFSDDRQTEEPIYVIFSVRRGTYFNNNSAVNPRNRIRVEIAKAIDSVGVPTGATITGGTRGATGGQANTGRYTIDNSGVSFGDFVRYAEDTLTILIAADGILQRDGMGSRVYLMPYVYLHVERLPFGEFAALVQSSGINQVAQPVEYTAGSVFSRADLQDRPGGVSSLYASGTAVVSAIYAPTTSGELQPLKRVFTCPVLTTHQCDKPVLNFAGESKPYLQLLPGGMLPRWNNTCWLFEWE